MANDNNLEESMDFVARQVVFLSEEKNLSAEAALKLIGAEASAEVNAAVKVFEGILSGDKLVLGKASPFHTFTENICDKGASPESVGLLLTKFIKLHKEYSQVIRTYLLSLKNTLAYSGALITIAFIISLLYSKFVLTGINAFFTESGGNLPTFTTYMMGGGIYVVFGLLLLGILFVISFSLTIQKILKETNAFRPVSSWMARLYVSKGITMSVNRYLLLNYIYLLLKNGDSDAGAIDKAVELVTGRSPNEKSSMLHPALIDELHFVSRLGTLGNEIGHLLENASDELQHHVVNFRSKVNIGFQIMIFTVIGALVIAYYLPLFKLASMV
jgi:type IV pilus assembly protein PilC